MKWLEDPDHTNNHIPPRAALLLIIFFAALVVALVACAPVKASDPSLSNVPIGQAPDIVVYTVQGGDWWLVTDCTVGIQPTCRTIAARDEDAVVQWVYRLQREFWVEYIS